jgi:hypothetical protein
MGFYVAIVLVAALVAIDDEQHRLPTLAIIWGTTIGLALAHLFAFRLASRLVGSGEVGPDDGALALAQLAGAATVAILASIPVLLFDTSVELDATRLVLVGSIGVAAYAIGRGSGAGRMRALLFAGGVLVLGVAVALFKNYLAGH